jgi:hypothetical protein
VFGSEVTAAVSIREGEHIMSGVEDNNDRQFAIRAADYLRQQGLSDEQVEGALVTELGLKTPEAAELAALSAAA